MLTKSSSLTTTFYGMDFSKYSSKVSEFVNEFASRANKAGQFLNWVNLPSEQLKRVDEIYSLASSLKSATGAKTLSVLGIGGSKHTVEHMLSINGLNINRTDIEFYSDIDSASFERFLYRLGNDVTSSNYLVASKSGSTFETKDGMLRIWSMLIEAYKAQGKSEEEAKALSNKHFIAVTDCNAEKSELRRTSNANGWLGDLYIHDDVGGRFSAFDDHALFTLAYAGMKKEDMITMLESAQSVSSESLTADLDVNDALKEGIFWSEAKSNGIDASVHQYMGAIFENTVYWHAQMQNESVKDTLKQVAKVPDAMHHSAEAHFNPANKLVFALTVPSDSGVCAENSDSYIDALTKSYSVTGSLFVERLETKGMGLSAEAAGRLTQLRAFATVYQEIVSRIMNGQSFPEVLDSVLQPHVEFYKKNLKGGVVVPGRIS
jgi:glucose-6-phosphate isomerase